MTPLHDFLVRDTRQPLLVLLAAVALLLLIACANVGNLLLVRASGREREAALRLALGAGRGRLIRQALTESLVLSVLGGAVGLLLGWWGTPALLAMQPPGMLPVRSIGMDRMVLGYALAATTASGLLFGIAPAVWSGNRAPAEALEQGGRTNSMSRRMRRWSHALVVGEVAIALLLTIGAGLLLRSFLELFQVSPGFDPHGVLAVKLNAAGARYGTGDDVRAFYDELIRRAQTLPGVESAAATSEVPLTNWGWTSQLSIAGREPDRYVPEVAHREVTPGYFRAMRVPILRGRDFTPQDDQHAPMVVLINQALARSAFAGQEPIGQRVAFDKTPDAHSTWRTIVGIVGDEHQTTLGAETKIQVIAPFAQEPRSGMELVVRTDGSPVDLAPLVRRLVADIDKNLAITSMRTMDEVRAGSLARQRFLMTMLILFAVIGLALALVGVYGVMAQYARGRTREMGIRLALGAQAAQVRWLVVRHGLQLVAAGLGIGLAAAVVGTRAIRAFLYRVTPRDPATFAAVIVLILFTAGAAAWFPARRASRRDPASTFREE